MFANSGAEAVENAVKIARKATGRSAIVSFERAYHGRTLLTMSLTSKVKPSSMDLGRLYQKYTNYHIRIIIALKKD